MPIAYRCERSAIELALEKLKAASLVAPDAVFNHNAPDGLRREVTYRDFDFLSRLSRTEEASTVRSILAWLKDNGIVDVDATYDEKLFDAFRQEVKEKIAMPGTSISPVMERLLYMLCSVKTPRRVVGIGTYYGNALLWAAGASFGVGKSYNAEMVLGIDINVEATEGARRNFGRLAHTNHVELLAEDGLEALDRLDGPIDLLFLDADGKETGKGLYLDLVMKAYDKLDSGAWVMAHDVVVPPFAKQLADYMAFVRNPANLTESILFDIDAFGLELSIK